MDEPFLSKDPDVDLNAMRNAGHNAMLLHSYYAGLGKEPEARKALDRAIWYGARADELEQQIAEGERQ